MRPRTRAQIAKLYDLADALAALAAEDQDDETQKYGSDVKSILREHIERVRHSVVARARCAEATLPKRNP